MLAPESLGLGWCLLLCVVIQLIAIDPPVKCPAAGGFQVQSMFSSAKAYPVRGSKVIGEPAAAGVMVDFEKGVVSSDWVE